MRSPEFTLLDLLARILAISFDFLKINSDKHYSLDYFPLASAAMALFWRTVMAVRQ